MLLVCSQRGLDIVALVIKASSQEESFDLCFSIVSTCLALDTLPTIWDHLNNDLDMFSPAQLTLLKMLDGMHAKEPKLSTFTLPDHRFILTTNHLIQIISRIQSHIESTYSASSIEETHLTPEFKQTMTAFVLISEFLKRMTQAATIIEKHVWIESGFILTLINLLQNFAQLQPAVVNKLKQDVSNLESHPLYHTKCDVLRLLSDLSFECTLAQNTIREQGGLALILNQCVIDDMNPCKLSFNIRRAGICAVCDS